MDMKYIDGPNSFEDAIYGTDPSKRIHCALTVTTDRDQYSDKGPSDFSEWLWLYHEDLDKRLRELCLRAQQVLTAIIWREIAVCYDAERWSFNVRLSCQQAQYVQFFPYTIRRPPQEKMYRFEKFVENTIVEIRRKIHTDLAFQIIKMAKLID